MVDLCHSDDNTAGLNDFEQRDDKLITNDVEFVIVQATQLLDPDYTISLHFILTWTPKQ